MEVDMISQLVSNVGFPIAVSVALFYQNIKMGESVSEFKSIITKNTLTIERLVNMLDRDKRDN